MPLVHGRRVTRLCCNKTVNLEKKWSHTYESGPVEYASKKRLHSMRPRIHGLASLFQIGWKRSRR